jgi:hypothetical protein
MTATELLKDQLDDAGYQLTKVLEGMPEEALDKKLTPSSMSPREQVGHLCEAYEAFKVSAAGGKYEWGSYQPDNLETSLLVKELEAQRAKAVSAALNNPSDSTLKHAHEYILGHDYYHVGQMCLARLAVQTDWDPYAIYRS